MSTDTMRTLVTAVLIFVATSAAASDVAYWTGQMRRQGSGMVACEYAAPSIGSEFWITVSGYCPMSIRL